MNSSFTVGLTGGPGCGKSAVSRIFQTFPAWTVLDADKVCHEIYAQAHSPWCDLLAEHWGKNVIGPDGTPDKKVIAEKIFANEEERLWLNSVLHPEIRKRLQEKASAVKEGLILMEIPLLFESAWENTMDCTIAVWSAPEIQMRRLLDRNWTADHAKARIASQFSADKKLAMADYGIINNGSLEELHAQCVELDKILKNRFEIANK